MKLHAKRALQALALLTALLGSAHWAAAQAVPTLPPLPPLPPGNSVTPACELRPRLCQALHIANLALIMAAQVNDSTQGVCTIGAPGSACQAPPPQAYILGGPQGNPSEVDKGRKLLDWYLTYLNCTALCAGRPDARVCEASCNAGQDPSAPAPKRPPGGGGGLPPKR